MPFVCDLCNRSFSRKDSLTRHKANKKYHDKLKDNNTKTKYYCLCGKYYIHNQSLHTHKKSCEIALEQPNIKQKDVVHKLQKPQSDSLEVLKNEKG